MPLHIQNPFNSSTTFLLEAMLAACENASFGAGTFAFASRGGVRLLMNDQAFASFISKSEFQLIVGVDAITNEKALEELAQATTKYPNLKLKAFIHQKAGAIFHPKTCWFKSSKGAILITGSGNLTTGGLRGNWEAFSVNYLDISEAKILEKYWNDWLASVQDNLKDIDDPEVKDQASQNVITRRSQLAPGATPSVTVDDALEAEDIEASDADAVLIAEIPKAGDRWNQANFNHETVVEFFEVQPGTQQRIVLFHVDDAGRVSEEESRQIVSVVSKNYRFELKAANGLDYPNNGRPIGVFLKIAARTFRYMLLMPTNPYYKEVNAFLTKHYEGREDRMRRIVTTVQTSRQECPNLPLWL